MKKTTKTFLFVCFGVFFVSFSHWPSYGSFGETEITSVFTTDFAGNPKTIFHPGDNVRYHVEFELNVGETAKVIASGNAKGLEVRAGGEEGIFKTDLEKQREPLNTGAHSFSWDESIPVSSLPGGVSYKIKVKVKDGGEDLKVGLLTVEEASSKIVFVRDVMEEAEGVENMEVYIMNPDGSDQAQLTFDPAEDRSPDISPNGMQIAFASDRTGNFDIWVLDLETGTLSQLTNDPADDLQPDWSPDGKKIAFTSLRDGDKDIWVMDVDSGDLQQYTFNNYQNAGPHWSTNGKLIAFVSDIHGNDDIFRMQANGKHKERLTFDIGDQRAPNWSPATREIAVTWWELYKSRANIYAMDKNGDNVRQLTFGKHYDRHPTWSPNGAQIAFLSNRASTFDIWTMSHDGSSIAQITASMAEDTLPDWGKTGFSDEYAVDTIITGKGKINKVHIGNVYMAEGGALMVEMSWDDDADLDLCIEEPGGTLITWKNPEGYGRHKGNVMPGPGTEVYTLSGSPQGTYRISAYYKNFETTAHWRIRWRDGSFSPLIGGE